MEINTGESTQKYHLTLANLYFIEISKITWFGKNNDRMFLHAHYKHEQV